MTARTYSPSPRNLRRLAAALQRGELVAIPTETVYGLAANALDPRACRRIFTAKRRPANDPLIVHVPDLRVAGDLAELNDAARALARRFWPGPLTLVLPRKPIVPGLVTSGQDTVALRSPAHPLARRLLRLAGLPLAAPSANLFGYVSPTTAGHVRAGLGRRIRHILDGGACPIGVESTIVDVTDPRRLRILRPGAIPLRALLAELRRAGVNSGTGRRTRHRVLAPGLLEQHYSPHTPLTVRPSLPAAGPVDERTAWLFQRRPAGRQRSNVFHFSRSGRLSEVARNLYAVLRAADTGGFDRIVIEAAPKSDDPLAVAINDRLARAAGKRRAR